MGAVKDHRWIIAAALLACAPSLDAQYTGPSVLSRSGSPGGMRNAPLAFRPYLSVTGIYETGLTGFATDEVGRIPDDSSAGVEASFGGYAYHNWKRTTAGFDYRGALRHYTRQQYYDGIDQFMGFAVNHQLNARTSVSARQVVGLFTRGFGVFPGQIGDFGAPSLIDTPALSPTSELFDNRTTHLSTMGQLVRQVSPRLSFGIGGSAFAVRRRATALLGVNGYSAEGDAAYRLSRHTTLGINYGFVRYDFTRAFGGANVHTVGVNYSWQMNRRWQMGLMVSGFRVENESIRRVQIDPLVALIIGQTTGFEAFHAINYSSGFGARLSRSFRQAGLTFSYTRGVSPGNGLLVTSRNEIFDATFTYTGIRTWNLSASAGYNRLRSMTQIAGTYDSAIFGAGFTRQIWRGGVHMVGRYDYRRYETTFLALPERSQSRISIGFSFAPGDIPLSLW